MKTLTKAAYALVKALVGQPLRDFRNHLGGKDFNYHPGEKPFRDSESMGAWIAGNRDNHKASEAHHRGQAKELRSASDLFGDHPHVKAFMTANADAHSHLANMHEAFHTKHPSRKGHWDFLSTPGSDLHNHSILPAGYAPGGQARPGTRPWLTRSLPE